MKSSVDFPEITIDCSREDELVEWNGISTRTEVHGMLKEKNYRALHKVSLF